MCKLKPANFLQEQPPSRIPSDLSRSDYTRIIQKAAGEQTSLSLHSALDAICKDKVLRTLNPCLENYWMAAARSAFFPAGGAIAGSISLHPALDAMCKDKILPILNPDLIILDGCCTISDLPGRWAIAESLSLHSALDAMCKDKILPIHNPDLIIDKGVSFRLSQSDNIGWQLNDQRSSRQGTIAGSISLHSALDPGEIGRNFTGQAQSLKIRTENAQPPPGKPVSIPKTKPAVHQTFRKPGLDRKAAIFTLRA